MRTPWTAILGILLLAGCGHEPGSTVLTKGDLILECDEAVAAVMKLEAADFHTQYQEANVILRQAEGRAAISDFAADSVEVIVTARPLNKQERDALAGGKIQFQEYKVALTAVAVIVPSERKGLELRTGQLDSIYTGTLTRWPGTRRPIDAVMGGRDASTNEVFKDVILKGKEFSPAVTPMDSSAALVAYVGSHPDAIGIVGLNWLSSGAEDVAPVSIGTPGFRPDSTEPYGAFYPPGQYYVYKGYYPLTTPIYIYNRRQLQDVADGFIAYVSSPPGQRIFLNSNLVPATQPVRLVSLTSEQVH